MAARENYIKKTETNAIKGTALIIMFIHHFFAFPDRIVRDSNFSIPTWVAEVLHDPTKICVSLFAFLTGYFYYYNQKKSFKDSLRKATNVYINYITVFALFIGLDLLLKCYNNSFKGIILELFVIDRPHMEFCWYVFFYIMIIFILPIYSKLSEKNYLIAFFAGVIVPFAVVLALNTIKRIFDIGPVDYIFDVLKFISWFPSVASGYLFAQRGLFWDADSFFGNKRTGLLHFLFDILAILLSLLARMMNASFDFLYAPMFIFGLLGILRTTNQTVLSTISVIGKYSLLMWFFHCIFFNVSKEYTQPILYYPHNAVLVLLWGLLISLLASIVLSYPINWIIKQKDKLLRLI